MVLKVIKHPQSCEQSLYRYLWYCINIFTTNQKDIIQFIAAFTRLTWKVFFALFQNERWPVWGEFYKICLLLQHDFAGNLVLMFMSNHLICWPTLKSYAKRSFSRKKMLEWLRSQCLFTLILNIQLKSRISRVYALLSAQAQTNFLPAGHANFYHFSCLTLKTDKEPP